MLLVFGLGIRWRSSRCSTAPAYSAYLQRRGRTAASSLPATRGAIYDRLGDALAVSVPRTDVIADDFQISNPDAEARTLAPMLKVADRTLDQRAGRTERLRRPRPIADTAQAVAPIEVGRSRRALLRPDSVRVTSGGGALPTAARRGQCRRNRETPVSSTPTTTCSPASPGASSRRWRRAASTSPSPAHDVVPARAGHRSRSDDRRAAPGRGDQRRRRADAGDARRTAGSPSSMDVHTGAILAMVDLVVGRARHDRPGEQNLAATSIYQPGSVMKLATFTYRLARRADHAEHGVHRSRTRSTSAATPSRTPSSTRPSSCPSRRSSPSPRTSGRSRSPSASACSACRRRSRPRLRQSDRPQLAWRVDRASSARRPTWYGSSAGSVPIGTGDAVTPLQVLDAYNTVANGGVSVTPHLVAGLVGAGRRRAPARRRRTGHRRVDAVDGRRARPDARGRRPETARPSTPHIPGYTRRRQDRHGPGPGRRTASATCRVTGTPPSSDSSRLRSRNCPASSS